MPYVGRHKVGKAAVPLTFDNLPALSGSKWFSKRASMLKRSAAKLPLSKAEGCLSDAAGRPSEARPAVIDSRRRWVAGPSFRGRSCSPRTPEVISLTESIGCHAVLSFNPNARTGNVPILLTFTGTAKKRKPAPAS